MQEYTCNNYLVYAIDFLLLMSAAQGTASDEIAQLFPKHFYLRSNI